MSAKAKVLFVCENWTNGGMERVVSTVGKALASDEDAYEVSVLIAQVAPVGDVIGGSAGPEIPGIVPYRIVCTRWRSLVLPVARRIRAIRPDVVMLNLSVNALPPIHAGLRLSRCRFRSVMVHHGAFSLEEQGIRHRRINRWLIDDAMRRAWKHVAVCDELRQLVLAAWPSLKAGQVVRIYNPIDVQQILELAGQTAPIEYDGLSGRIICMVARLSDQKDFDTLVRAFAGLKLAAMPSLFLVGDGPERDRIGALAHRLDCDMFVHILGWRDNPFPYLKYASVAVLISHREGFPLVLPEAMACGTPIVASDCLTGPREILQGGRCGRLVPEGDVPALTTALREALSDTEKKSVQCRQALNRVHDFDSQISISSYIGLVDAAVASLGLARTRRFGSR